MTTVYHIKKLWKNLEKLQDEVDENDSLKDDPEVQAEIIIAKRFLHDFEEAMDVLSEFIEGA